jgi:CDP-2,3-bis-(O-geranylgeranyl)-sn-glycerol synthase
MSDNIILISELRALALLLAANGGPWLAARVLGDRWGAPVDMGLTLADGRRLLGAHKTWRGLVVGVLCTAAAAILVGLPWILGAGFALLSLLGDLLSSAWKRRLGRAPGAGAPFIDQLPESLLPVAVLALPLGLNLTSVVVVVLVFALLNMASSFFRERRTLRTNPRDGLG